MSEYSLDLQSVRESVGVSSERLERALTILDGWVAQGRVPGVAALVVRRGSVVARHFRGLAAPGDASLPLNADTIFPLSSVTKPLVALALLALVESGDVMLEDPVRGTFRSSARTARKACGSATC